MSKIKELNAKIGKLQQELMDESKRLFTEETAKFFEKYPQLENFSWTQYTPYFADGDECIFSAHTDYFEINGLEGDSLSDPKRWNGEANPDYNPVLGPIYDEIKEFLKEFNDDFYKLTFDNHVKVTVTKDGTTTESYEHD